MLDQPIKSVQYEPASGELFSVRYLRNLADGSYRDCIFKALASDGDVLVADKVWSNGSRAYPSAYNRHVFVLEDWAFRPASKYIIAALESPISEEPQHAIGHRNG
jgi:hypothetical protein